MPIVNNNTPGPLDALAARLAALAAGRNLRTIPGEIITGGHGVVDLSSNDYLGIAADRAFAEDFLAQTSIDSSMLGSSASRLLGPRQQAYSRVEATLERLYGHGLQVLTFGSGYHANVGLIQALSLPDTLFLVDKLAHASMIDGLRLGGADFKRFPHQRLDTLERWVAEAPAKYARIVVVVESVYSMDGDSTDLAALVDIKRRHPRVMLYVDEAHAVGVCGPAGLGLTAALAKPAEVDIMVGTFGKALASSGAWVLCSPLLRQYFVNHCRSLIFSTAQPPLQALWSTYVLERMVGMDDRRERLRQLSQVLALATGAQPSHIQPYITGSSEAALQLSAKLLEAGYKVLPIRTPTVPPGTERLRFSLSADLPPDQLEGLKLLITHY